MSHSKIKTFDESYCEDTIVRVVFNFSEKSVDGEDRSGQPGKETGFFEGFSSTDYSKLDYDHVWSSPEWKGDATTHDRSGQPVQTS